MLTALAYKARVEARAAAFSAFAGVLLVVGLAFFTVSAWLALSAVLPTATVALIVGGVYFGLALVFFGIVALIRRKPVHVPPAARSTPMPEIIQAFVTGMAAGQGTAATRR
ncbi:hypothetical protein KUV65_11010 [Maritalea mobilis]|uniref:phage holin family protein n=1 Tax=Maritalea mobilis TaxID=483324 RepID=UPI001C94F92C|nr:phage holin family protein [Maritalea mobilis]MBY6201894.1 hypothetical protein [Maritalea mobilis]